MALVALAMVGIIAMAALSIDVGTLYQASAEAQRSADQAALAGAKVLSFSGMTGDPANTSSQWSAACTAATQTAQTVANQNTVGGRLPSSVNVTYLSTDTSNCTSPGAFGTNPMVKVQVVQASLPTYFSRIWGRTGSSVSATATAEVFNPSSSSAHSASGNLVPVQPRCVKPMIVPNLDPGNPAISPSCTNATPCNPFVNPDGSIFSPGIRAAGGSATAVIGETFNLVPDCSTNGPNCNAAGGGQIFYPNPGVVVPGNLQYVPGLAPATSSAVPSCANGPYQQAVAGCDQSTAYQCGVQYSTLASPNLVDLNENPGIWTNDTSAAAECLIQQVKGQDALLTSTYPYEIQAGAGNPIVGANGLLITNSNSIVSIPIYDGNGTLPGLPINVANQAPVTIVGFLQVFINNVPAGGIDGTLNVTVLNVAGCGTNVPAGTTAVYGTSPVPVRLITPP
jgi:Flp pilus assembly protein TadG